MERGLEDMSSILKVEDLVKYYGEGENQVRAVDHTSLQIERGKFTAIVGRSGSGKSTLLHLIGGLDRPDSGKVWIDGTDIYSRKDDKLAQFRRKKIGFIFQDFNLIPSLNVWENIVLPLGLDNRKVKPREVEDILKKIGLQDKKGSQAKAWRQDLSCSLEAVKPCLPGDGSSGGGRSGRTICFCKRSLCG